LPAVRFVRGLVGGVGATLLALGPAQAGDAWQKPAFSAATDDAAQWTPAAPVEHMVPFYGIDWSLGLRGAYINDSQTGERFKALVLPSVTLSHTGSLLSYHATGDAELSKTGDGQINVDQARLSAGTALAFDPNNTLESNASVSMSQEDPHSPDVASNVAETPLEISGSADSTYTRKLGRFNVSLSGNVGHDLYGPTTLTDGTTVSNDAQDNTHFGGGLRLGFQLTPVLEPFVKADVTRTRYDIAPPAPGTKLDGNLYSLMSGISAKWDTRLTASASAGVGLEHFDSPGLADVQATLYDANLTYKPDDTLTLTGDFSTSIGAPGPSGSGTAAVSYQATANATYLVNDWLDWRGSAGWHDTSYAGTSNTDTGYTLGVGADYLLSKHAKLTADYTYQRYEVTPSPPGDTHSVMLGVTFQK